MTLKTRRFTLYDQLYKRFLMEPRSADESPEPGISPILVPFIDISELYDLERDIALGLNLSGAGNVVAFTVPEDQRWHMKAIVTTPTVAGSQMVYIDPVGDPINWSALATAQAFFLEAVAHIILDPLWQIARTATGNGSDTSEGLTILFKRERLN